MKKFYMIGNTHFDPVWLWRWEEAMASIRATFRSALDRMNEDPDFIYSFATPPVFEWIKKTDPALFEEIRQRVREGRWELAEGWWLQPDCYVASAESYIRQGLYGQRYLKENFGQYSDCVFNIDSFGHSPALPQILKKSGIDYYCLCRPEGRHIKLEHPLFQWQGIDGSKVLAYRAEGVYQHDLAKNFASESPEDELIVYGVTDHGGAPTKQAIAEIHQKDNADFSTVSGFFKHHDTDYTVTQELLTGDFGPYANYSKIKKLNRIAEYAVLNAEKASLIAERYDAASLTACWKDIMFNQFHDILGGCCIKDAYFDAENMLGRAIFTAGELMHFNLQSVTRRIQMPGKNPDNPWNLVVWNLNTVAYDGYLEAEVQWMHQFDWYDKGICLEDGQGNRYECQIIREKSIVPRFRSRFIFKAEIPATGYKVFKLIQTNQEVCKKQVDPYVIETNRLRVAFSENGTVASVIDKRDGKQLANELLVPRCYTDKGDTWTFNVTSYENDPTDLAFEGFTVNEAGELMTELKAVYRLGHSVVEAYYRFYADEAYFDLRYRVHWQEKYKVLKLETPVREHTHLAAVPAGVIERGASPADVPLGAWVQADGITFVPNAVFAYRMQDNILGLTVLRSPAYGDMRIADFDDTLDHDIIDRGVVEGGLRVSFEQNAWQTADRFNNPPVIIDESNHDGELPTEHSYYGIDSDRVRMTAVKQCEDDDATVLRLIETTGTTQTASFYAKGQSYTATLSPFEIKTLKLANGEAKEVNLLEE